MKKLLLLGVASFVLFCSNCGFLAEVPRGERYMDLVTPGNRLDSGGANFIVEKTPDKHYVLKRFYYETRQQTAEISYSDPALRVMDGPNKQWLDDGKIWTEGQYENGKKAGRWKEYAHNGFNVGGLSTGDYKDGEKTGVWTTFDPFGHKIKESQFEAGKFVSAQVFNADGTVKSETSATNLTLDELQVAPMYPCSEKNAAMGKDCGERSLMDYLASNVKYPNSARQRYITGTALISFIVDKEGEVVQVKVLQGVCDDIKKVCYEVVSNMPAWKPGVVNDHPVRVAYTLPIRFKLE